MATNPMRHAVPGAVLVAVLASGCTGGGGSTASSESPPRSTTSTTGPRASGTVPGTTTTATTVAAGTNKWFPLEPGLQVVKLGSLNRGHRNLEHRRVHTITNVTKVIDGVRSTLILDQDFDGGELAEQAVDYLGHDAKGNVLFLGSYTESYEGGQFVNASDAWLAGMRGATQGTLMPVDLRVGTAEFTETNVPGVETTTGRVLKTGESVCVPFKCYDDVVVIQEGAEWKYFAPGVGELKLEPHYSGGEQETEELINVTNLSPQSLAEISAEALRLDEHARATAPDVFGSSQRAERAR